MGDPEDFGGREGTGGGGRGRETVGLIGSEAISYCPDAKESYNSLFFSRGDVGLDLNVSS